MLAALGACEASLFRFLCPASGKGGGDGGSVLELWFIQPNKVLLDGSLSKLYLKFSCLENVGGPQVEVKW